MVLRLIQNLQFLSLKDKLSQGIRALVWSLVSFQVWSHHFTGDSQDIPLFLRTAFFVTTILWLFSYQIGAFLIASIFLQERDFGFISWF